MGIIRIAEEFLEKLAIPIKNEFFHKIGVRLVGRDL